MQHALVIGTAISTVKHPSFRGQKLLVVQPLLADGVSPDADPVLAICSVGAGRGDKVIITSDGKYVREVTKDDSSPIRWSVLGTCDE